MLSEAKMCIRDRANSIQFTCMNTLTLIDLPNADASSGNSLLSTIMQLSIAVSIAAVSYTHLPTAYRSSHTERTRHLLP